MKRVLFGLCLAVVTAVSLAAAQGPQDFTLVNKTGLTIDELYISPADDNAWGEDVLGKDVLMHNEKTDIEFHPSTEECIWDMKIVDEDGDEVVWVDVNLCKAHEITLLYQNKKPTAVIK